MDKLECLNETEEDSVKNIFIPWENRLQKVSESFLILATVYHCRIFK